MSETLLHTAEFDGKTPQGILLDEAHLEERWRVGEVYANTWVTAYEDQMPADDVYTALSRLSRIGGLKVVGEVDGYTYLSHYSYRCAEYVFGYMQEEQWAQTGWTVDTKPELWERPLGFLTEHGYEPTTQPRFGDIVAYGGVEEGDQMWIEHYGILADCDEGGPLVISKFGQGPVVLHNINVVSYKWGDRYWFFSKSPRI